MYSIILDCVTISPNDVMFENKYFVMIATLVESSSVVAQELLKFYQTAVDHFVNCYKTR